MKNKKRVVKMAKVSDKYKDLKLTQKQFDSQALSTRNTLTGYVPHLSHEESMREQGLTDSTFPWWWLMPHIGVPLYFLFRARKLARLAEAKEPLHETDLDSHRGKIDFIENLNAFSSGSLSKERRIRAINAFKGINQN